MKKYQLLTLQQIDRQLQTWTQVRGWFSPKIGWIKTLRKALGITISQLAKRLQVDNSRMFAMEQAEINEAITLKTLNSYP